MNYEIIGTQVLELVKTTGQFIREQRKIYTPDKTESKGVHDLVSYVDKTAETLLLKGYDKFYLNQALLPKRKPPATTTKIIFGLLTHWTEPPTLFIM